MLSLGDRTKCIRKKVPSYVVPYYCRLRQGHSDNRVKNGSDAEAPTHSTVSRTTSQVFQAGVRSCLPSTLTRKPHWMKGHCGSPPISTHSKGKQGASLFFFVCFMWPFIFTRSLSVVRVLRKVWAFVSWGSLRCLIRAGVLSVLQQFSTNISWALTGNADFGLCLCLSDLEALRVMPQESEFYQVPRWFAYTPKSENHGLEKDKRWWVQLEGFNLILISRKGFPSELHSKQGVAKENLRCGFHKIVAVDFDFLTCRYRGEDQLSSCTGNAILINGLREQGWITKVPAKWQLVMLGNFDYMLIITSPSPFWFWKGIQLARLVKFQFLRSCVLTTVNGHKQLFPKLVSSATPELGLSLSTLVFYPVVLRVLQASSSIWFLGCFLFLVMILDVTVNNWRRGKALGTAVQSVCASVRDKYQHTHESSWLFVDQGEDCQVTFIARRGPPTKCMLS